jgi:hypothetical protein
MFREMGAAPVDVSTASSSCKWPSAVVAQRSVVRLPFRHPMPPPRCLLVGCPLSLHRGLYLLMR